MPAFARLNRSLIAILVLGAAALAALTLRVRDWVVMTDELQYAKLATHIGETLSPLPVLRGVSVSSYAQVYPILLSPLYGTLSAPSAFRAAHVLNALLFASAAVPVYLLAREAGLAPRWRLACAALALVLPWNVQAAFLMTESVAYPVFCWTSLALVRAVASPTQRRDAIALAALVVAFFTRTQFLSLAAVLPLVVLLHDGRASVRRHRVLAIAYACGLAVAVVVQLTGGLARVLGNYAVTATNGRLLPWKTLELAGAHLDLVGVGIGLLPLLLGGAWLLDNASRRAPFVLYALVAIVVLTLETSSYDARFGGGLTGIRGRYLFYVAPLLLIAMARALEDRRVSRAALAAVTVFFSVTVLAHDFPRIAGLYVDAPVAVLNDFIQSSGGKAFVALAAIVASLAIGVPRWRPRDLAVTVVAFVFAASVATSAVAWSRLLGGNGPSGRPVQGVPGLVLDWVDRVLPKGAHTAMIPYVVAPDWSRAAVLWWDVEFWNRTVDRSFVVGDHWEYAPFPHLDLRPDPVTGVIAATKDAPQYVVTAVADARLRLAGASVGRNYDLDILQAERPYRAVWRSDGLDPDGWIVAGRPATIRVFATPGHPTERVGVDVVLVDLSGAHQTLQHKQLCVPAGRFVDLKLPAAPPVVVGPLPSNPPEGGERSASLRLVGVTVLPSGKPC